MSIVKNEYDFIQNVVENSTFVDDKGVIVDFALKKGNCRDKCYDIRLHRVIKPQLSQYILFFGDSLVHRIVILPAKKSMIVGSGVSLEMGEKVIDGIVHLLHCEVKTRSGLGFKYDIEIFNGQIDNPYNKELLLKVTNNSNQDKELFIGERIAQIDFEYKPQLIDKINRFKTIEELDKGGRNGFGSSGR